MENKIVAGEFEPHLAKTTLDPRDLKVIQRSLAEDYKPRITKETTTSKRLRLYKKVQNGAPKVPVTQRLAFGASNSRWQVGNQFGNKDPKMFDQ